MVSRGPSVRLAITLLFLTALAVFLRMGVRALSERFGPPLARHRADHDQIEARLEALEKHPNRASKP